MEKPPSFLFFKRNDFPTMLIKTNNRKRASESGFFSFVGMDYLETLNEVQRQAVEQTEGPVMVIAGAGSGKTRVLTYRIAHIINKGVDPFRILSLTFTNKAAREMKDRISKIVGESDAKNLWMGTFHSIFAKILRFEAEKIGYPSSFTIYDSDDSKSLIKTILKEMQLDDKVYKPNLVLNRISSAKNNLLTPQAYAQNSTIATEDVQSKKPLLGKVYETYNKRLFKSGAMDFDDLLFKTNVLLRDHPDVLYKYQEKFRYLMVDEFQDTNFSQYIIIKKLAARHENICVVGDDAQSIYAFRGASIQNILNFKKEYPDTKTFKLEQNYRSTRSIVDAANSVIAKNKEQLQKDVWTDNETGEKVRIIGAMTDNEEGINVARAIFDVQHNEHNANSDFAILYRTNSQSRSLEEALRKNGIPYKIYGGLSFYQRKEIKDLIAYFRLVLNPNDEEALKRIINYPARGIGKTTMDKVGIAAANASASLWDVVTHLNQVNIKINGPTRTKISEFAEMMKSFTILQATSTAYDLGNHIAKTTGILKDLYADKTPEGVSRYENIQELLNGMKDFSDKAAPEDPKPTLAEFIQDIALLTDTDVKDQQDEDTDKVIMMTIHASKGLEFPYVYIVGMEENLFPSQLSLNSRTDLEEERRLFYVALTRAEKQVTLSYATSRYRWGNLTHCEPSRFLEEIGAEHVDASMARPGSLSMSESGRQRSPREAAEPVKQTTSRPMVPKRKIPMQRATNPSSGNFAADDTAKLQAGMQVLHERFGKGKVVNIEGAAPNQKAIVKFQGAGEKQLLLKFARLKILS